MSGWLPVRRILRERFGAGGYQILRTGEIRVRRGDSWERFGSLLDPEFLRFIAGHAQAATAAKVCGEF